MGNEKVIVVDFAKEARSFFTAKLADHGLGDRPQSPPAWMLWLHDELERGFLFGAIRDEALEEAAQVMDESKDADVAIVDGRLLLYQFGDRGVGERIRNLKKHPKRPTLSQELTQCQVDRDKALATAEKFRQEKTIGLAALADAGNSLFLDFLQVADYLKRVRAEQDKLTQELEAAIKVMEDTNYEAPLPYRHQPLIRGIMALQLEVGQSLTRVKELEAALERIRSKASPVGYDSVDSGIVAEVDAVLPREKVRDVCPVDGHPCEGQGTIADCEAKCAIKTTPTPITYVVTDYISKNECGCCPNGNHRSYRNCLHDPMTDASLDRSDVIDAAIKASGARDGDEIVITVTKTGHRPFGDRRFVYVRPHTYEREPTSSAPVTVFCSPRVAERAAELEQPTPTVDPPCARDLGRGKRCGHPLSEHRGASCACWHWTDAFNGPGRYCSCSGFVPEPSAPRTYSEPPKMMVIKRAPEEQYGALQDSVHVESKINRPAKSLKVPPVKK